MRVPASPARTSRSGYGVPSRETSRVPPAPSSPVTRTVRTPPCSWWPSVLSLPCSVSNPLSSTFLSVKPMNLVYEGSPLGTLTYLEASLSAALESLSPSPPFPQKAASALR
ncbi:hypothetical protein SALBM217S_07321 [Streptomyces griseoloalbus]